MNGVIIEAAGWTLLHFLWQGALIGALFGLFLGLYSPSGKMPKGRPAARRRSLANARYLAGCLALLTMVGALAATFTHKFQSISGEARLAAAAEKPVVKQMVLTFGQCRPCHAAVEKSEAGPNQSRSGRAVAMPVLASSCNSFGQFALAKIDSTPDQSGPIDSATAASKPGASAEASPPEEASRNSSSGFDWLVAAWLSGVVLLSLRFALSWGVTLRLRGEGTAVDGSLSQCVRKMAERVGVTRPVQAVRSAVVAVPTVVGWLRPVILLPAASLVGLSTSQLEAVLAHELAHIRRHDIFVNLLQHLIETLLFFHPAVWWRWGATRPSSPR